MGGESGGVIGMMEARNLHFLGAFLMLSMAEKGAEVEGNEG